MSLFYFLLSQLRQNSDVGTKKVQRKWVGKDNVKKTGRGA
jgi:hypothetical protein